MLDAKIYEVWDVVTTMNDENGTIRFWRVVEDGSLVEYEGWPVDARLKSTDSESPQTGD